MRRLSITYGVLCLFCLLCCPHGWAQECVVDTLAKDLRFSASDGDERLVLVEPKTEVDSLLFYPAQSAQLMQQMPVALFSYACADLTGADTLAMEMLFSDCEMAYRFALPAVDEEQEFFLSLQTGADGEWLVGRVGEKEIQQDTVINNDTTDIKDTTIVVTPKELESLHLSPHDVVLSLDKMEQQFVVTYLPEDAENVSYEVRCSDPYGLATYNYQTNVLTAKYGMTGGKVTVIVRSTTNRQIADTVEVSIKPTVERTDAFVTLESWENLTTLGQQDTAYLSMWIYPQGAQSEPTRPAGVSFRVVKGAHLVTLTDEYVPGKGIRLYAQAGNEGGVAQVEGSVKFNTGNMWVRLTDTVTFDIVPQYVDMTDIVLSTEGGDTCLYLGTKSHTIRVLAEVLPDNASSKQLTWNIVEGNNLAEFDEQSGRLRLRQTASSIEDDEVVLRARDASYRTDVFADLHVYVSCGEGLTSTAADGMRRLVLVDGHVFVEIVRGEKTTLVDMMGRIVE